MTSTWSKRLLVFLAAGIFSGLALSACASEAPDETAAPRTGTASSSPAVEARPLVDVCAQVEAELPDVSIDSTAEELEQARNVVRSISETANQEAQNALVLLDDGFADAVAVLTDPSAMLPQLEVEEAIDAGIGQFADRCRAAGSSAFQ